MNLKNPDKIPKAQLDAIVKHFRQVQDPADLAQRAVGYIVDGEDEAALLAIGGSPGLAAALFLDKQHYGQASERKQIERFRRSLADILWPAETASPAVWMRIGKVLAAISAAGKIRPSYRSYPDWLLVLMAMVIGSTQRTSSEDGEGREDEARIDWTIPEWRSRLRSRRRSPTTRSSIFLRNSKSSRSSSASVRALQRRSILAPIAVSDDVRQAGRREGPSGVNATSS